MSKRKIALAMLAKHQAALDWCDKRRNKEGSHSEAIVAEAHGWNNAIESLLFELGLYAGFGYIGSAQKHVQQDGQETTSYTHVKIDDPAFREWRRSYYLKPER